MFDQEHLLSIVRCFVWGQSDVYTHLSNYSEKSHILHWMVCMHSLHTVYKWRPRPVVGKHLHHYLVANFRLRPSTVAIQKMFFLMASVHQNFVCVCGYVYSWLMEWWTRSSNPAKTQKTWSATRTLNTRPRNTLRNTCRSSELFTGPKRTQSWSSLLPLNSAGIEQRISGAS